MTPQDFIQKWRNVKLTERSASQQHFLDLCALVDHPTPATMDKTGETFTFERGAKKRADELVATDNGWADVWKKGFFAWEYKGPHKDLGKAYRQLQQYREDLENPPLLVVSDMDRIVVHTNFTATPVEVREISLAELGDPDNLAVLHALFHDPEKLRPGQTSERITAKAAGRLADVAQSIRARGCEPRTVARFLDRLVFCLFAEDIGLLPPGLFTDLLDKTHDDPAKFAKYTGQLFEAMAHGGDFLLQEILHFNGNLFSDCEVLELTPDELSMLHETAQLDWSAIDPSIFGTLFERGMDPGKRSQLGAHYTSREDIETLIEPVVMLPLRREWCEIRTAVEHLLVTGRKASKATLAKARDQREAIAPDPPAAKPARGTRTKARGEALRIVGRFHEQIARLAVLDPACGSGNFLYVTLQKLKDLEKQVIVYAADRLKEGLLPIVGPWQLHGIELSPYAYDLAQMTVWIGYLQWTRANGFGITQTPVLRPMEHNFQCRDAILDWDGNPDSQPAEPEWPRADCIVGNPPFLGDKFMRRELGDEYVDALRHHYHGRVPGGADLCCYWFEVARRQLEQGKANRAGLLATQGIRGGANRKVLQRIKETGDIFFAESDRPWVLDGANVHVSMVGFQNCPVEDSRILDGRRVESISASLGGVNDLTTAQRLAENRGIGFIGTAKKAPLDIEQRIAVEMLSDPNPHGLPNSDVVVPFSNGLDVTRRCSNHWIIDYPMGMPEEVAACYQMPFQYVCEKVRPLRENHREAVQKKYWWRLARPCPDLRKAVSELSHFAASPRVAKHRLFIWFRAPVVPDCQLVLFARSDDYFFGVLHSRFHEVWALAQGTQLREKESGFRYTPTSCFETFPFPWPPGEEPAGDACVTAIAECAKRLCELRDNWLNPPEWTATEVLEFPGTVGGPWDRYIERDEGGRVKAEEVTVPGGETIQLGTVHYPRTVPKNADCAEKLKKRTLTKLYNARPAWLDQAHADLDLAVAAAYTQTSATPCPPHLPEDTLLERLLELNLERGQAS